MKNWNWKIILLNAFIIICGFYFANDVDLNKIAVGIVYAGMAIALVWLNKE
jgi:hypothetical protein